MAMRYPGGLIAPSPVNAAYPSGVWTQSQTIPYASQNVWQNDQYWRNTTLLLHGDGTNGAQNNTFLDSSTNNFTITRNGNTTQGAFTPYQQNGYWGNYFDGASSLLPASNAAFNFGTGDFTVEAWVYQPASGVQCVYDSRGSDASAGGFFFGTISTNFVVYTGGATAISTPMQLNTWMHFAIVRSGSTWTLYKNGVSSGTYSSSANLSDANRQIGASTTVTSSSANYLTGYISNLRVVKGTAVYTAAFTPSASPLTAITNTSLLACQSNRFIDNSSNAFTITATGSPSVQAFQPFPGPTTWSASVLGGSGYFDGSGDYLFAGSNAAFAPGTGDFTFQAWVYPLAFASPVGGIFDTGGSLVSGRFSVVTYTAGVIRVDNNGNMLTSSVPLQLNAWTLITVIRNGSTMTLYFNGTSVASASNSVNFTETQSYVGRTVDNYYFPGFICDLRFVKGTALTNAVPTAPLSSVTNTSLLLNFTNAGIFDNAQMNDLETVGNAQVSTSIVKYGTGSMAFDGSGDYLVGRTTDLLSFNTGDFTAEMWVYPNSVAGDIVLIDTRASGTDSGWAFYINSSGKLALFTSNANRITAGSALSTNTWAHVVLARSGSTLAIYINGVQSATATYSTTMTCPGRISIASGFDNAAPLNGYIDDLRITKGVARYITNFTPPIARMPNQ